MSEDNLKENEAIKLTMKDRRIIRELNKDSRQSFSEIGKKVGLPKNVVNYRVNRMVDDGIITLFCTTINRWKLGYMYCRLFLKFDHFSEKLSKDVLTFISGIENIHWVANLEGNYDICIIFIAKSPKQMDEIYNSIIYKFDKNISEKEMSMATRLIYLPYNYLYDKPEHDFEETGPEESFVKLDDTDSKLINLIKENSRLPMLELMKKLDMSPQSVRTRMKSLMKNGIITGFNIRIDHTKFRLHHFHVFLRLSNMRKNREREIITFLCSKKSVTHIIKGMGIWDMEFETVLGSHFDLHDLLKEIKEKFPENITKYDSSLIYKVYPINTVRY